MTKFGLLYERLIVQPKPRYPDYYLMVQRVLEEMKEDFPSESNYDFGDRLYHDWYEKWFGVRGEEIEE